MKYCPKQGTSLLSSRLLHIVLIVLVSAVALTKVQAQTTTCTVTCSPSLSCCGNACYSPQYYNCDGGKLCSVPNVACVRSDGGFACYNPNGIYACVNGNLVPKSSGGSFTCSGKTPSDPTVCSSHGTCTAQDTCSCTGGYTGANCQTAPSTPPPEPPPSPPPSGGFTTIRLNCGGNVYGPDSNGATWAADTAANADRGSISTGTSAAIDGTTDDSLYQTGRYQVPGKDMVYSFSVPNDNYLVTLGFSENWSGAFAAGRRVFDCKLNGAAFLTNFDIFQSAGAGNKAITRSQSVTVTSGTLEIRCIHKVENPIINTLSIVRGVSGPPPPPPPPPPSSGWVEVWTDNFDTFDTSKWSHDIGDGCPGNCQWGNFERQWYRPQNAQVQNGLLTITATRIPPTDNNPRAGQSNWWYSSKITTSNKFSIKYGRVDVRARMDIGAGPFPAIWMFPQNSVYGGWPNSGEIDLVEYSQGWGVSPHTAMGFHFYNHHGGDQWGAKPANDVTVFKVYSLIWTEAYMTLSVDGNQMFRYDKPAGADWHAWPFDQNFFLIINLAMNPSWAPQAPSSATSFKMDIDYVKVFRQA